MEPSNPVGKMIVKAQRKPRKCSIKESSNRVSRRSDQIPNVSNDQIRWRLRVP